MSLRRFFDIYLYEASDLALLGPDLQAAVQTAFARPEPALEDPDALIARRHLLHRISRHGSLIAQRAKEAVDQAGDKAQHAEDKAEVKVPRDHLRDGWSAFLSLLENESNPINGSEHFGAAAQLLAILKARGGDVLKTKAREMRARVSSMREIALDPRFADLVTGQPLLGKRLSGLQHELAAVAVALRLGEHEGLDLDVEAGVDPVLDGRARAYEALAACITVSDIDPGLRHDLLSIWVDLEDRLALEHKGQGGRPKAGAPAVVT